MGELRGDLERVMGQRAQQEQRPLGRNSSGIFKQQRDFYQLISGDERKMLTDQQSYLKTKRQAEPCRYPSLARKQR